LFKALLRRNRKYCSFCIKAGTMAGTVPAFFRLIEFNDTSQMRTLGIQKLYSPQIVPAGSNFLTVIINDLSIPFLHTIKFGLFITCKLVLYQMEYSIYILLYKFLGTGRYFYT